MYSGAYTSILLGLLLVGSAAAGSSDGDGFTFIEDLKFDGVQEILSNGSVISTNETTTWGVGHTFYALPFRFKDSVNGSARSFSTSFVFAIVPDNPAFTFHGMAFALAPSKQVTPSSSSQHLGLFNRTNDGDPSNHIVAIEFDTFQSLELGDINNNHVGLDINSIVSVNATPAGYFDDRNGRFRNLTLASSQEIRAWVDYDGVAKRLNVTIAPLSTPKPARPLLALDVDISPFILEEMFVGFSSSTGVLFQSYYLLGWSFQINSTNSPELDLSRIPPLPRKKNQKQRSLSLPIGLGVSVFCAAMLASAVVFITVRWRRRKFREVLEDWEVQYGPHRFSYKDLYVATKGFKKSELLGRGGFGEVYKGVLPELKAQVAVKKISHDSGQGMKEFVAEIATLGRLRHPKLVRLLGYCRRKGELFLVYDYMPNASLDKFLFNNSESTNYLSWNLRFKIIMDVAEALAYLHEQWVEVIIHRDIKASNVLLDGQMNGKLGDFGLARRYDHGNDAKTTHLAGTLGYIAPELARKGKATTGTDVFAFGAFCLEVACGRRPVELNAQPDEVVLAEWVLESWWDGEMFKTVDSRLNGDFSFEEMELVLLIGLLCSHNVPRLRPSMSQVVAFLKGDETIPKNLDNIFRVREESGRISDTSLASSSAATPMQYSMPSVTITELFTSVGR